jgi:very-long-chain enoyl-CoA reductase
MAEYAGPLFIYLLFYIRPSLIYGSSGSSKPIHLAAQLIRFI